MARRQEVIRQGWERISARFDRGTEEVGGDWNCSLLLWSFRFFTWYLTLNFLLVKNLIKASPGIQLRARIQKIAFAATGSHWKCTDGRPCPHCLTFSFFLWVSLGFSCSSLSTAVSTRPKLDRNRWGLVPHHPCQFSIQRALCSHFPPIMLLWRVPLCLPVASLWVLLPTGCELSLDLTLGWFHTRVAASTSKQATSTYCLLTTMHNQKQLSSASL